MAFEETKEQQQMYSYFRSCIYIFLIIEIVMNLPVTADNRVTQFILDILGRFKVFNSVAGCKVTELVCICVVCIGTKAKKALKFNVRTMVIYPVLAGLTLVGLCFTGWTSASAGWASRQAVSSTPFVRWRAPCWCIRGWTASPGITTTRWAKTVSTSRTNPSNSRKCW